MDWSLNVFSRKTKTSERKERYFVYILRCVLKLTIRQDSVARRAYIQSEVTETLRPFYCTVCEKQFQNVAQYDEHCNSYAHHHKIRFKEMQLNERAKANSQEAIERRREKERKREERELRKAAKAVGVKLTTVTPAVRVVNTAQNPFGPTTGPGIEPGPAAGSWLEVSSSSSGGGFKKPGWATISSPVQPPSPPPPPPSEPLHITPPTNTSGFRSGGWSTLEGPPSASTPNRPLTPNAHHQPPPPPEPVPTPNPLTPSTSGFKFIPLAENTPQIQQQPTSRPVKKPSATQRAESSRSGWQSFSRGGSKR